MIFSPSSSMSISSAKLISGSASGGNSTSTTGPKIATTHPSLSSVWGSAVAVMTAGAPGVSSGLVVVLGVVRVGVRVTGALAQRFRATDDLHDLGRDRVLTGPVHAAAVREDQLLGVVGSGFHRALAGGVLRRGGIEQRRVHPRLGVAREQRLENRFRVRLELVVGARSSRRLGRRFDLLG